MSRIQPPAQPTTQPPTWNVAEPDRGRLADSTDDARIRAFARKARKLVEKTDPASLAGIPTPFWLVAALLWEKALRFDPAIPLWPDRDRFFVSSTHLLPLRNTFLHLTDQPASLSCPADIVNEFYGLAGGLPGQAIAAASGMALAEQCLTRRFGRSLVDHQTWLLALPSDLDTGVAMETAALASRFQLDRLVILVADSPLAPTDPADIALSLGRFEASGWAVRQAEADDPSTLAATLAFARRTRKPTLIFCRSGAEERRAAGEPPCSDRPDQAARSARSRAAPRRSWLKRLTRHPLRAEFERTVAARAAPRLHDDFQRIIADNPLQSLIHAGLTCRETLTGLLPELVSLSAGHTQLPVLMPEIFSDAAGEKSCCSAVNCGPREAAMVGFMNGLALHGGVLPCGTATLSSADRMRPALRFAALTGRRLLLLLIEDDPQAPASPPWRQVEQFVSLRAMPNLALFRPADRDEVISSWISALDWRHGPAVIVLARQEIREIQDIPDVPDRGAVPLSPAARPPAAHRKPEHGGYVLMEAQAGPEHRDVTLIASGPEVSVALQACHYLREDGIQAAVVSLLCWELFEQQDETYRQATLGAAPRVAIEAASGFGWERWVGEAGIFIGNEEFGVASGLNPLYQSSGIAPETVCARVRALLGSRRGTAGRVRKETQKRGGDTRLQAPQ